MSAKSNFLKHFLPFGVLCVGAFVGLTQFRKLNYTFGKHKEIAIYRENLKDIGMNEEDYQFRTTESLAEEYEKTLKRLDLDKWKNIRGPRPWENSKEIQEKQKNEDAKKKI